MKIYESLYNESRSIILALDKIGNDTTKITRSNFRSVKAVELIKQALNNVLVETMALTDLLYQLSIIDDENDLELFLDLAEVDDESD